MHLIKRSALQFIIVHLRDLLCTTAGPNAVQTTWEVGKESKTIKMEKKCKDVDVILVKVSGNNKLVTLQTMCSLLKRTAGCCSANILQSFWDFRHGTSVDGGSPWRPPPFPRCPPPPGVPDRQDVATCMTSTLLCFTLATTLPALDLIRDGTFSLFLVAFSRPFSRFR